ncbi:MAG: 6-phosphofructokinase [Planctomycetes bacterium]|nr:6-phosphofructokinase [Planctomycetota bacterium]
MTPSKPQLPVGNALIGQSGGPTAVINQSLVGVVEGLRGHKNVKKVLGAVHALRGIVDGKFIELNKIGRPRLERLAQTPSAALGSSRDKPNAEYCRRIFDQLNRHNIRYFFYIGGNDSSDTCRIVSEMAKLDGYALHCFHVPKTIDNDLMCNDHTPGFASAAKFVAQAFMGDNLENAALPGIKINIIMGRHAGFLTAASVLARQNKSEGPHLIYVPEVPFSVEGFLGDVERVYKQHGRCLIAVSEGIHDSEGTPIITKLADAIERDSHGNVQLSGTGALGDYLSAAIKGHMGKDARVRADTFGYLQRCFAGCVSPVDAKEARQVGREAARHALLGVTEGSIAIERVSSKPYKVRYRLINVREVAAKTRTLPPEFIVNGNNISESYRGYLSPLVGKLPVIETIR